MRILLLPAAALLMLLLVGCQAGTNSTGSKEADSAMPSMRKGEELFRSLCMRCHNIRLENPLIGPALYKVDERVPGKDWLRQFIRNSTALIESGDPYAVKLYESNNKAYMDPFPQLSDAELDSIISFISDYEPEATP